MSSWNQILLLRTIIENKSGLIFENKREATSFTMEFIKLIDFYRINHFLSSVDTFSITSYPEVDNKYGVKDKLFVKIYKEYNNYKCENGFWDFQDLICERAIDLLNEVDLIRSIRVIFIDECQDVDASQFYLFTTLFNHRKFYLIGDLYQKIYSWRYAYPAPMYDESFWFDRKYKSISNFELANNYRSTANIVKLFNAHRLVNDKISNIQSIPIKGEIQGSVKLSTVKTDYDEGKYIAEKIKDLINDGISPKNIVVLGRTSGFLKTIVEPSLVDLNIEYKISTPQYKKKLIETPLNKILIAFFNLFISDDDFDLMAVSKYFRGISPNTMNKLMDECILGNYESKKAIGIMYSIKSKVKEIINNTVISDYNIYFSNVIRDFMSIIKHHVKDSEYTSRQFLISQKIFTNVIFSLIKENSYSSVEEIITDLTMSLSSYEEESDCVILTTIHQYKGLENSVVFVGNLTHTGQFRDDGDESQLIYVALSRAVDKLFVVDSKFSVTRKFGTITSKLNPYWAKTKQYIINEKRKQS